MEEWSRIGWKIVKFSFVFRIKVINIVDVGYF